MEDTLKLPLLSEVLPSGLRFGSNYLVEFEPQSLWYETSLNLCAQSLKMGVKADYHTFTHTPEEVRRALGELGLPLKELEENDTFRIWDSYTVQTGFGQAAKVGKAIPREFIDLRSLNMADWSKEETEELSQEVLEVDKRRLHVDDNTSILVQFNEERSVFEHFRTRTIPYARHLEMAAIHSIVKGAYSDSFYNQFEAFCDGIIDFKTEEEGGRLQQYVRIRMSRGRIFDSSWHRIRLSANGEVSFVGIPFGL